MTTFYLLILFMLPAVMAVGIAIPRRRELSAQWVGELVIATALLLLGVVLCSLLAYYSKPRFYSRAMQQYKDYVFHELTKKSISAFTGERTSTYVSAL